MNNKTRPFVLVTILLLFILLPTTNVMALPEHFQDTVIWSGFDTPTAISFAPNGKVFVAEKSGIIKVFDNLEDTTPTIFADLSNEVQSFGDRGLLGLTIDPQFPTRPYVYVLYTMDAPPGSTPPIYHDTCSNPSLCPASSRLAKLTASGNVMIAEQILLEAWCQSSSNHSVGTLFFGTDGALYVSHGEGSSSTIVDYGQKGGCSDPVNEGGALRSQDLRTSGDPVSYNGALLRLNPDTAAAFPQNPLAGGTNTDDDRIISYGFRNPFRFNIDPLTGSIWIADVGWHEWEEINYISNPKGAAMNFGWPCYEGAFRQSGYDAANIPICEGLYTAGVTQAPYYAYSHSNGGNAAITAIVLYRGNNFPAAYNGALFFADYNLGWIRVMMPGSNGLPNPATTTDFISTGAYPVDLKVGPNAALYYVDIVSGTIHRISYSLNNPPVARATASPTSGSLPLFVNFDGSTSSDDDDSTTLQYAWDLDGDGVFSNSTAVSPVYNYTQPQTVHAKLRVTDSHGASNTDTLTIYAGNRSPTATIFTPSSSTLFNVGDVITFSGEGRDPDSGLLPPSALKWEAILHHCAVNDPNECHAHGIQTFTGVDHGSIVAPDHEYPARIEFRLTVADPVSPALTTTANVVILPRTTTWTFTSNPNGLQLAVYGTTMPTPFTRTVIVNAQSTISAPSLQQFGASTYQFHSWSDAGAATHTVTASGAKTFNAVFTTSSVLNTWHSWEVMPQAGSPQGVAISNANITAPIEFYESVNNVGVTKGALFNIFEPGVHAETFNKLEKFWSINAGAAAYPYAGKSTVNRGADVGEGNAQAPLGTRDLQMYPASNDHNTVTAFKIPQDGTYTISDLGVRRIDTQGGTARLHVFNPQGAQLTTLTATNNQDWVTTSTTFTIADAKVGQSIYFGVDRNGDAIGDAVEISWTISATLGMPPIPTCTLYSDPSNIPKGYSTKLSWNTTNATGFSIDQGLGSQSSVGSGTKTRTPSTTTTYTGTATGAGGSATCSTKVTVTTPSPKPTCSLSVSPPSINPGHSSTLSWITQNATALSINQNVSSVTPVASGSRSMSPTSTTTYTGTATGSGGSVTCSATISVPRLKWNSWDVITQSGSPQAVITSMSGGVKTNVEFYESTNVNGVIKGSLFNIFTSGMHQATSNNVAAFWANVAGVNAYPYAGKSTINRGSDAGETNAAIPLGVRDLQLHPPLNDHNTIAAFKIPHNGTYIISHLGIRRVSTNGNNARLRVYNAQGTPIATLNATNNRLWVTTPTTYTIPNLTVGQSIYFGVDRNGDSSGDAAEISWTVTKD